ncbi:MAG: ATP synthase F1 subunit delta [Clostridiales bacterium]|nr:ATP synthase F1 subunit delta [Clostridiales bacterium]
MIKTSNEYADALFSLAMDLHAEDETLSALQLVRDSFRQEPDALAMLASPSIPKSERLAALESAFAAHLPQHVMGYMHVLCNNGHIREFDDSVMAYEELYNSARKLSTAVVTSAVELSETEKSQLQAKLEKRLGRTIRLECAIDESLLGGLVVQVDGKVIDGSLKHRLHEIKEVMNR